MIGDFTFHTAILKRAQQLVEQWDNHDKFRVTSAEQSLFDPDIGEPTDVATARLLINIVEGNV